MTLRSGPFSLLSSDQANGKRGGASGCCAGTRQQPEQGGRCFETQLNFVKLLAWHSSVTALMWYHTPEEFMPEG